MLFQKIKKIISGIVTGVIIILACYGGFKVYETIFTPSIAQEVKRTEVVRTKLNSIGKLKVAESEQKVKKVLSKGNFKLFSNVYTLIQYFKTSYEYDLKDVAIFEDMENKSVQMIIYRDKLTMSDVYVTRDESYSTSGIIAPNIEEHELNELRKLAKEDAVAMFISDEEFYNTALTSLKEKLNNLVKDLGFENITILVKEFN